MQFEEDPPIKPLQVNEKTGNMRLLENLELPTSTKQETQDKSSLFKRMNCFKQQNSEENPLILLNNATSNQGISKTKSTNSLKQQNGVLNSVNDTQAPPVIRPSIIQDFEQKYQLYQDQIQEELINQQLNVNSVDNYYLGQNLRPSFSYPINVNILKAFFFF